MILVTMTFLKTEKSGKCREILLGEKEIGQTSLVT